MPSFTSSSDRTDKRTNWWLTWAVCFLVSAAFFISYERFLKQQGFKASITDNKRLWSWYRAQASNGNPKLVLLGASRSQLNISVPYLKQQLKNHDVLQLSVNAQYPMATLKSLADDHTFSGTVLLSLNAQALEQRYLGMQQGHNDFYHKDASFNQSLNAYLVAQLQSQWRFLHPSLGLQKIITFYQQHRRWPEPPYTTAHVDRSISADYAMTNIKHLQKHFYKQKLDNYQTDTPTAPNLWHQNAELLQNYAAAIAKRGGTVIVVRFPTDKGHWQLDEQFYPRQKYWDKIGGQNGLHVIHFNDIDGMKAFDLPDSSHLDFRQKNAFTEVLLNHLIKHNVITP